MPIYTIEKTYRLPVYKHERIEADSPEEAMQKALESDDWEGQREDYESSGPTYITGAWEGEEAYGPGSNDLGLPIPDEFSRTAKEDEHDA
jgi:hypothetical protein